MKNPRIPPARARLEMRKPIRARARLVREFFAKLDEMPRAVDVYTDKAGVDRTALSHWRAGRAEPKLSNFEAIVEALGGRLVIEWGKPK